MSPLLHSTEELILPLMVPLGATPFDPDYTMSPTHSGPYGWGPISSSPPEPWDVSAWTGVLIGCLPPSGLGVTVTAQWFTGPDSFVADPNSFFTQTLPPGSALGLRGNPQAVASWDCFDLNGELQLFYVRNVGPYLRVITSSTPVGGNATLAQTQLCIIPTNLPASSDGPYSAGVQGQVLANQSGTIAANSSVSQDFVYGGPAILSVGSATAGALARVFRFAFDGTAPELIRLQNNATTFYMGPATIQLPPGRNRVVWQNTTGSPLGVVGSLIAA